MALTMMASVKIAGSTARTPLRPPMRSVAVWGPIAAVTVLAILVIIGVWHRIGQRHDQENFAQRTTQLEVNVATAQRDSKPKELILPGTFQAFNQTTIFPRSNGYVESWKVRSGLRAGWPIACRDCDTGSGSAIGTGARTGGDSQTDRRSLARSAR